MQLSRTLVALLLVVCHVHPASAAAVHARQDGDGAATSVQSSSIESTATARNTREGSTTATIDTASHAAPTATQTSSRDSAAPSTTAAVSTTALTDVPSAAAPSDAPAASSTAAVYSGHGLPLPPKVTPAIGIAGAVLMITGAVYTFIGIKNVWINIGGSVGFLVALSITVLIEYVMNPPVTDAVQGAFFVAAFIPALLAGGVAYIFKDLTEGSGCMLGGFCLSMWFLVLKPGGLITSTTGKAIFIGVLSAAGWALSFSRYTRTYGLIGCTSFAGATVTVIGIDCFSRAGLKEFWLYLWDLNDNTFPLFTDTYPHTRGIRVEIACIIIITLLGIASQMKLWKVVKARRAQRDAARRQREEDQQRMDEETGRKILEETDRERVQWEAMYGNKDYAEKNAARVDHLDSGVGSEHARKASVSVREVSRGTSEESIEMCELEAATREGSQSQLVSQYATPAEAADEIQHIDGQGRPRPPTSGYFPVGHQNSVMKRQDSMQNTGMDQTAYSDGSAVPSPRLSMQAHPPPQAARLPFVVPTGNDSSTELLEQESVASMPEDLLMREDSAQRLPVKPTSHARNSRATSEEQLIEAASTDDDRASSIAATLDDMNEDVISLPALSRVGTPFSWLEPAEGGHRRTGSAPTEEGDGDGEIQNDSPETVDPDLQEAQADGNHDVSAPRASRSLTSSTNPKSDYRKHAAGKDRRKSGVSTDRDEVGSASDKQARSKRSTTQSEIAHSGVGSLSDHLPEKLSKVMLTYRTNEWAKHVSMADQPELESIPEPSSPGVMVDLGFKQAAETSRKPVDSTPPQAEAEPELEPKNESQFPVQMNPYRQSLQRSPSSQSKNVQPVPLSRNSSSATVPTANASNPQVNLQRNSSSSSLTTPSRPGSAMAGNGTRGLRISSSPVNAPIVEQPSEEMQAEKRASSRLVQTPLPTNTLMGERDSRMRSRPTKMSFITAPGQSPVAMLQSPQPQRASRAPSISNSVQGSQTGAEEADPDNMPLSQRRMMIQKNRMSSQNRNSSYPTLSAQNFNSHQPQREPPMQQDKREQMFASWRGSLQQDQHSRQPAQRELTEGRRSEMISERRNKELVQQQREINRQNIDMMIHEKMRSGQMQQLHRERLRRLQSGAKTE
ncbi:uncharacterized protein BKCO1_4600061 [Diplodia corticola]|uniref:TM7S3/TM198-like domain-containing protein n=1 Tax=Diplodia corticola TaxID=236234 RepID=A0A1J9RUV6_9PEZI|nr:uncharacterized protein BKCO1_4600061 [Diplodia corticola]OJD31628.1 hypothetical protein BKCO1_4600061 [Diplodia corticola]